VSVTSCPADWVAARQGDRGALERLLTICRPNIRRYAQWTCGMSAVEDAVQETLLILCRYLPTLRSAVSLDGWLATVVLRECLRLARRFGSPSLTANALEAVPNLFASHSETELRLDIALAIQSLPVIYRDVLLLRDFEEETLGQIARRLTLPLATAKTRLYRSRVLVREYLLTDSGGKTDAK